MCERHGVELQRCGLLSDVYVQHKRGIECFDALRLSVGVLVQRLERQHNVVVGVLCVVEYGAVGVADVECE